MRNLHRADSPWTKALDWILEDEVLEPRQADGSGFASIGGPKPWKASISQLRVQSSAHQLVSFWKEREMAQTGQEPLGLRSNSRWLTTAA